MIGVGGRPHRPDIPGAHLAWVSDDMFQLERFPERMVVVGAGFIACEFAGNPPWPGCPGDPARAARSPSPWF